MTYNKNIEVDNTIPSLKVISHGENEYIGNALKTHTDYYRICCEYLKLLNCVKSVTKNYELFLDFHTNVLNDLSMASLSIVRRHFIQSQLVLRHALESAVLACYSLEYNDMNNYLKMLNDMTVKPKKVLSTEKDKAYDWLNKNFPEYSKLIENNKNLINTYHAHANNIIRVANRYFESKEDKYKIQIFESYPDNFIDAVLMVIINTISIIIHLYIEANKRFKKLHFVDGLDKKLSNIEDIRKSLEKSILKTISNMFHGSIKSF